MFFDYKDHKNQTVPKILANIVRQLLEHLQNIPQDIQSLYDARFISEGQKMETTEQRIALIELLCKSFRRAFLIVDALDECPEYDDRSNEVRAKMASSLLALSRVSYVFVTSRPNVNVASEIPGCITLKIQAKDSDLRAYLKARKTDHKALKRIVDQDPALGKHLEDTICRKSKGMCVSSCYGCLLQLLTDVGSYSRASRLIR